MPYLTYEEFNDLVGFELEKAEFNKLLPKASAVLDHVTNHFYQRVSMESDNMWRVEQFKRALCAQIEYFYEVGATTFESINNAPQSFSAGRTTVSYASRFKASGANETKPLVAEDVYVYLEGTGLLYAGVTVW